jgi:hypothetical protein
VFVSGSDHLRTQATTAFGEALWRIAYAGNILRHVLQEVVMDRAAAQDTLEVSRHDLAWLERSRTIWWTHAGGGASAAIRSEMAVYQLTAQTSHWLARPNLLKVLAVQVAHRGTRMPPTTRRDWAIRLDGKEVPGKRATAVGFVGSKPLRQTVSLACLVYVSQMIVLLLLVRRVRKSDIDADLSRTRSNDMHPALSSQQESSIDILLALIQLRSQRFGNRSQVIVCDQVRKIEHYRAQFCCKLDELRQFLNVRSHQHKWHMKPRAVNMMGCFLVSQGLQIANDGIPFGSSPDALKSFLCSCLEWDVQFIETCLDQGSGEAGVSFIAFMLK